MTSLFSNLVLSFQLKFLELYPIFSMEALFNGHDLFFNGKKICSWLAYYNEFTYMKSSLVPLLWVPLVFYHNTVGGLHYLGFTRLDVAFRVHCVSKSMHQPMENHWQVVKRIHNKLWHLFQKYIRSLFSKVQWYWLGWW